MTSSLTMSVNPYVKNTDKNQLRYGMDSKELKDKITSLCKSYLLWTKNHKLIFL